MTYLIVARQRSGTHLLASYLNSHPDAECLGECFHPNESTYNFFKFTGVTAEQFRHMDATDALHLWKRFYESLRHNGKLPPSVGPIAMYDQINRMPKGFFSGIASGLPIIHLVRDNVLRMYVSGHANTMRIKPTHTRQDVETKKFRLPPDDLIEELDKRVESVERARKWLSGYSAIEVKYESLSDNPSEVLPAVREHIGLDNKEMRTTMKRTNPGSLSSILSNYREIAEYLKGTRYEGDLS